jgi:channel protein (hemolysin III family)
MNEYGIEPVASIAEPVASITHLLGAGLFALLSVPLLMRAWNGPGRKRSLAPRSVRVISVGVFCASIVLLLTASGLYHSAHFNTPTRAVLLQIDYAAIFILIAGTFTPACAILFENFLRWAGLGLIWGAASVGIALKCYAETMSPFTTYFVYLGLGWLGIFAVGIAWRRHGPSFIEYAVLGGAAYTAGAAFQIACEPNFLVGTIGPHELLHIAVLVGIACHWKFIYQFAHGHVPMSASAISQTEPATAVIRSAGLVTEPSSTPANPVSRA